MKNLFDRAKLFFSKDKEFRAALYNIMGFYPHNIELYRTAFAHKSLEYRSKKTGNKPLNNERLEFLGDAVLETVVSDIVYRHFPNKREGFLTNTRSKIVSRESLGRLAKDLGIDRLIQSQTYSRAHNSYLGGNSFEALMGAIYLDRGFAYAFRFVEKRIIGAALDLEGVAQKEVNFKSKLLEWGQKNKIRLEFKESNVNGNNGNQPNFLTTIIIESVYAGEGKGFSKKESHQAASKDALTRLRREPHFLDSVYRAKEKRTAMAADECFVLPKIDEIEAELAKPRKGEKQERPKRERAEKQDRKNNPRAEKQDAPKGEQKPKSEQKSKPEPKPEVKVEEKAEQKAERPAKEKRQKQDAPKAEQRPATPAVEAEKPVVEATPEKVAPATKKAEAIEVAPAATPAAEEVAPKVAVLGLLAQLAQTAPAEVPAEKEIVETPAVEKPAVETTPQTKAPKAVKPEEVDMVIVEDIQPAHEIFAEEKAAAEAKAAVEVVEVEMVPELDVIPEVEAVSEPEVAPSPEAVMETTEQVVEVAEALEEAEADAEESTEAPADEASSSEAKPQKKKSRRKGKRQSATEFTNTTPPPAEQSHRAEKAERRVKEEKERRAIEKARQDLEPEGIEDNNAATPERTEKNEGRRERRDRNERRRNNNNNNRRRNSRNDADNEPTAEELKQREALIAAAEAAAYDEL